MAEQTGFRLYFKEGIRRIIEPRFMLMHLPKGVLVTTTCFSTIWRGFPVVGLEVVATGLEIAQDDRVVVLSIRTTDASVKQYASVSRNLIAGITDLGDRDVTPAERVRPFQRTLTRLSLFGKPDPHRFYIRPLRQTGR